MSTMDRIHHQLLRLSETKRVAVLNYLLSIEEEANATPPQVNRPIQERRERLRQALKEAMEQDPFREIADPVAWQRDLRLDRPLPGWNPSHDD
ncbi:MAG: hypothetical protein HQL97_02580 [Magnetococcales bacterium]|nr:hypothetical protein [Magnetococcales bacterium]MBF0260713.1 hypothetical protein [Magnetococcales bacterium]